MNKADYRLLAKHAHGKKTLARQFQLISRIEKLSFYSLRDVSGITTNDTVHQSFAAHYLSPAHLLNLRTKLSQWLPAKGDPVFMILIFMILTADNPFTRAAAEGLDNSPLSLAIARQELDVLECIARTGSKQIFNILSWSNGLGPFPFDGIEICSEPVSRTPLPEFQRLLDLFASPTPWAEQIPELERWHRKWGCGIALYKIVFQGKSLSYDLLESDKLSCRPLDNVTLPYSTDFIGYEDERNAVRENTRRFVNGLPAQDVLLYGDRGTGKSSTVKLMLREFSAQGLRMISTDNNIENLKKIFSHVHKQRWKYILFIDDISFNSWSGDALEFRSLLQGDLSERPANVLFYVTSNRKTILRMETADTNTSDPQVDAEDRQEMLALSDRFGLKVWFQTPTQDAFLAIVRGLAKQHKINLPDEELVQQALKWERWNNVRSPRSAQQFIRGLATSPLPS